ncbi:hypothetical protein Micbo1qcDRAFT_220918 [Microdochium bolleyi]|uniref:DUF5672 domain-containing protein n=1 Tax=Microdochium bolleyi TaxID=196109 RepID=A0A136JBC4_9PEZI|nr:hypothetical protein Micbo1qcDRAFT_220918 [Microdochium bolleyi]
MGAISSIVRGLGFMVTSRTGKRIVSLFGFIIVMIFLAQLAFPDVASKVTVPVPFITIHYPNKDAPVHSSWSSLLSSGSDDEADFDHSSSAESLGGHGTSSSPGHPSHQQQQHHHHHKNKNKHHGGAYLSATRFNESKVALLIENRPTPFLAPLMLHFMSVIPPDWRFRFMGSRESVDFVQQSFAIRQQVGLGKLDLTYIPSNMTTSGSEAISQFLTNLWVYETLLQPAEWLLVFQTDSMLCANSRQNLDDYLDYDWVGAPWNPSGSFGGNGGLSLRRVSSIVQVLRDQRRIPGSEPEDVWLTERLGHRPGAKMANGTLSLTFSGEMNPGSAEMLWDDEQKAKAAAAAAKAASGKTPLDESELDSLAVTKENIDINEAGSGFGWTADNADPDVALTDEEKEAKAKAHGKGKGHGLDLTNGAWKEGIDDYRVGFYEPMGYHIGSSGENLHGGIWGTPALRKHIWDYCPEVKIMLQMDAAEYVPGDCNANWKRDGAGEERYGAVRMNDFGHGTEWIDGIEYPALPPGFSAW